MESLGKAQVIASAWEQTILGKLPKRKEDYPDWYRRRMEACDECPRNTRNMAWTRLRPKVWFQSLTGKPTCSVCGCFLRQKAWMRTESCPLAELGEKPKWEAMEVVTADSSNFNISCDDDTMSVGITEDGNNFFVDVKDVIVGDEVEVTLKIFHKDGFYPDEAHMGCGCIGNVEYSPEPDADNTNTLKFILNTDGYAEGPFRKHMNVGGGRGEKRTKDKDAEGHEFWRGKPLYFPLEIRGVAHNKK